MQPTVFNKPLKIMHGFPYRNDMTFAEKCEKITAKLEELNQKGFGGVVSNVPFDNYTKSPENWDIFRFIVSECERLGMRVWIYDENGYPSGGAGGMTVDADPDFEATGVVLVANDVEPGQKFELALPHGHMHFLSIAVYKTAGGIDGITDFNPIARISCRNSKEIQRYENKTDERTTVCAFIQKRLYEGTHAEHNVCDCRRYIDVTYAAAVREFLNNTYEAYKANIGDRLKTVNMGGNNPEIGGIEAIFTDEPSLMGCYINAGLYPNSVHDKYDDTIPLYPVISWGHDFENTFKSLCGYDCLDNLIYKFIGKSDAAKRYRLDYHRVLSFLFEQSFYTQISDWCAANKLNFSGHILLEDDIRQHVLFEGNFFSFLRHMHYPGIDMLHSIPETIYDQYLFTPKLVSSIAIAYGRKHVMSEVSAHAQGGKVTIPQQYASVCLQYALGVDIFTYYYGENFMDTATYAKYNASHARIDAIMSGDTLSEVLLYYPIETMQMHHIGSDAQYGVYTQPENVCHDSLSRLMYGLTENAIGYDFADTELLSNCRVENGTLFASSGRKYSAFLLPECEITTELAGIIAYFRKNGLKVFALGGNTFAKPDCDTFENADKVITEIDRTAFTVQSSKLSPRIAVLARNTENGNALLFVNANPETGHVSVTVNGMNSPELYSPLEDKLQTADVIKQDTGYTVSFEIGGYDTLILMDN